MEAQNIAIMTNHSKAKKDKTQKNSRCRLFGDRDETNNHVCECGKFAQKEYKTKNDKGMARELCKKLKFDYTN